MQERKILLTSLLTLLIEKCVLYLSLMPRGSELGLLPDEMWVTVVVSNSTYQV